MLGRQLKHRRDRRQTDPAQKPRPQDATFEFEEPLVGTTLPISFNLSMVLSIPPSVSSPAAWIVDDGTNERAVIGIAQTSLQDWLLTVDGALAAAATTITVPQNDPTFKTSQGGNVLAGVTTSNP